MPLRTPFREHHSVSAIARQEGGIYAARSVQIFRESMSQVSPHPPNLIKFDDLV